MRRQPQSQGNGTYVVATNGIPLIVDPGMEIYNRDSFGPHRFESMLMNSFGHDVPYIGNTLQKGGKNAVGKITSTSFEDDEDALSMDLTATYDLPSLIKITRSYALDCKQPAIEITDTADFRKPTNFGSALITGSKWKEEGPGSFLIFEKDASVQATVTIEDAGSKFINNVEPLKAHRLPVGYQPMRLGFDVDRPITHVVMHTLIVPTHAPATEPRGKP